MWGNQKPGPEICTKLFHSSALNVSRAMIGTGGGFLNWRLVHYYFLYLPYPQLAWVLEPRWKWAAPLVGEAESSSCLSHWLGPTGGAPFHNQQLWLVPLGSLLLPRICLVTGGRVLGYSWVPGHCWGGPITEKWVVGKMLERSVWWNQPRLGTHLWSLFKVLTKFADIFKQVL